MKYIILYSVLKDGDYAQAYDVAFAKEDIPAIIKFAKKTFLIYNFSVLELGKEVTKEFVDNKE